MADLCFSPRTPVSSNYHDITEILLKVVFRTHNPVMRYNPEFQIYVSYKSDVNAHNPVMRHTYESDVTPQYLVIFLNHSSCLLHFNVIRQTYESDVTLTQYSVIFVNHISSICTCYISKLIISHHFLILLLNYSLLLFNVYVLFMLPW